MTKITRTIKSLHVTVRCADTENSTVIDKEFDVACKNDDGKIIKAVTALTDLVPLKVVACEEREALYSCTLDQFLSVASPVKK